MTSHRIVNRIGLLGLMLATLAALWIVASQSTVAQSPNIDGQAWQFDAGSTGNVAGIIYSGLPAAGLGAADISVAFDSTVLAVTGCGTGDLQGACNPNAPGGPARAAGFRAPAITTEPVTIATLTVDCVGAAGSNSALTITVNELVDGSVGGQAISASVTNGTVTCGESGASPPPAPTASPGGLPPTGGEGDSSGSYLLIVMGIVAVGAIAVFGALGGWRVVRRSR